MCKLHRHLLFALSTVLLYGQQLVLAAETESSDWKQSNVSAISAMRAEKYEEAEKLFQEALKLCKTPDDKKTVKANLEVLLHKMGRDEEALQLHGEVQLNQGKLNQGKLNSSESEPAANKSATGAAKDTPGPRTLKPEELSSYIKQIDEKIKKADASADLDNLQNLFKLKADAVRMRDKGESLEYAYILHFRAQVLHHLKRNAEAESLDRYATQVRDYNRMVQQQLAQQASLQAAGKGNNKGNSRNSGGRSFNTGHSGMGSGGLDFGPEAPTKTRSTLSNFDTYFDPTPPAVVKFPTQDYTTPSSSTYLDPNLRNPIDKNTSNIQKTERKFGEF